MRAPSQRLSLLFAALTIAAAPCASAQNVADLDPHVRAAVVAAPAASITLRWNASTLAASFVVRRRAPDVAAWMQVAMLPGNATEFEDRAVEVGQRYEYVVQRTTAMGQTIAPGYGYVIAGIDVPFRDDPGVVALVVEAQTAMGASAEVDQLEADLRADGWTVDRVMVAASASPAMVRAELQRAQLRRGERLRAALLVGAVPRAFSGNIRPDGHADHEGAWPSDGYYADLDGDWPDARDYGGANFNVNRAGDGKFDPSTYPSRLELAIGRVDAEQMPVFSMTPVELVRRYLARNHAYRVGEFAPRPAHVGQRLVWLLQRRGVLAHRVARRLGALRRVPRARPTLLRRARRPRGRLRLRVRLRRWQPAGRERRGQHHGLHRAHAPRCVRRAVRLVLRRLVVREQLLARTALLAFARVGHAVVLSTDRTHARARRDALVRRRAASYDSGQRLRRVQLALAGASGVDGRSHAANVHRSSLPQRCARPGEESGVALSWTASADSAVVGYHVFRSTNDASAPAERVTATPVVATSWRDEGAAPSVELRYRVVAVAKVTTGSGTFFNHSLGVFATATRPVATVMDASVADASGDGASAPQADASADSGAPSPQAGGCACSIATSDSSGHLNVWALYGAALLLIARRSRPRRGRACA
jgi:hypothetical protein